MVHINEVLKHTTDDSLWIILHNKVYDMTGFAKDHPGGKAILMKYGGKDATKKFDPIHPKDVLDKYLPATVKLIGPLEGADSAAEEEVDASEKERLRYDAEKPPLDHMLNLHDFKLVASKVAIKAGWSYFTSAADDEITARENHMAYQRIWFNPKVLVDITHVDISTSLLGSRTSVPFYISATASGKLAHPLGEVGLAKAAGKEGVIQMISSLSSCSLDEILDAALATQHQWLQVYVDSARERTKQLVQHAERRGIKALVITVDAPQLGRREKDMRIALSEGLAGHDDAINSAGETTRGISSLISTALTWKDIAWFKSITKLPIVIKGVQRPDDVLNAIHYGCQAVVLSNHGGRQLEFSKPTIQVLGETMNVLAKYGLSDKIDVFIDGGVRRGTDIVKALCLGAKGVGLGRPFLYALSSYGDEGVAKAIRILKDEVETAMRLLGVNRVDQLNPSFIDATNLGLHTTYTRDALSEQTYEPLWQPEFAAAAPKSKL